MLVCKPYSSVSVPETVFVGTITEGTVKKPHIVGKDN